MQAKHPAPVPPSRRGRRDTAIPLVNRKDATSDKIKQYILERDLRPGDPLPAEQELCVQLGVSRSSVREALRRLEALDLVQVKQGRGSFVGSLSMNPLVEALAFRALLVTDGDFESLREVVETRHFLDLGIAAEVCAKVRGTKQKSLTDLVNKMHRRAQSGQTFFEEDFAFHDQLLELTDNHVVRQLVASFWQVHQAVVPRLGLEVKADLVQTAQAHHDMLAAALAGDTARYLQALDDHYQPIRQRLNPA